MAYKNIENLLKDTNQKPWEYSFEMEAESKNEIQNKALETVFKEKGAMERFLIYRSTSNYCQTSDYPDGEAESRRNRKTYGDIFDFDGSGEGHIEKNDFCRLTRDVYRKLWAWNDVYGKKFMRYGTVGSNLCPHFGPDTMNSAQTIVNEAIKIIAKDNPQYEKKNQYTTRKCIDFFAKFKIEFVKDLEKNTKLNNFVSSYHKLGNFVLVPAGFNSQRGLTLNDFWDSSLQYLKQHVNENIWLSGSVFFTRYINHFFLWDYVICDKDSEDYLVKSMVSDDFKSSGDCITLHSCDKYMPNESQVPVFLTNAEWAIRRRGIFMTAMLKLATDDNNKNIYEKLQKKIFSVDKCYNGFKEVIDEVKKYNLPPDVLDLLQKKELTENP